MPRATALLLRLRAALEEIGDPRRSPEMQRYMKSAMPFHGVSAPQLRACCREVFHELRWRYAARWRSDVLGVWRGATHREERHAAIELTGVRAAREFQTMAALPLYEEMIVTGAWWDFVDAVATHRLSALLRLHPRPMRSAMMSWSRGPNPWKRRAAILCQIPFKADTDTALLRALIEPSIASKQFFLRKAIGWALRQYAWTDPRWVTGYVAENKDRLSGLSRREALKNVVRAQPAARGARRSSKA